MSKQLTLEELSVVAHESGLPQLKQELAAVESAISAFADKVAAHLGVACGQAEIFPEGTFCGFSPVRPDQPLPEAMKPFDSEGDWEMTEVHRNGCATIWDGVVNEFSSDKGIDKQALAAAGQVAKFCGGEVRPDDIILVTADPDALDRDMGDIICVAGVAKPDGGEKYRVEWNSASLSEGIMDYGDCDAPAMAHSEDLQGLYATFATPDLFFTDRDSAVSCALAIAGRIAEKINDGVGEGVQVLHAHPKLGIARSEAQDGGMKI